MKKVLLLTLSSLFLTACDIEITTPDTDTPATGASSLADISGVWNLGNTSDQEVDKGLTNAIPYLLITEAGKYSTYAYLDWSDSDAEQIGTPDCYIYEGKSITDLGEGIFEINDSASDTSDTFAYTIVEDQLVVDGFSYSKASLQESDLIPLCEDHAFVTIPK